MLAEDAEITESTGKTDNILLSEYIENNLNGIIPTSFQNPGGRIHVIN